ELPGHFRPEMETAAKVFGFRVPRYFAALMQKGCIHDPLLLQVLPSIAELRQTPGYTTDPLEDQAAHEGNGILHKYHGRVLLITTGACAINCRYCFRRHFPYAEHQALKNQWQPALSQLGRDASIHEIILSGGDPLMLGNDRLATLIEALEQIPHIQRLRIHTRLPVVLPARIDARLIDLLGNTSLACSMVIHANHPRELTPVLEQALSPLRHSRVTLLNQSVLLKHVNDDIQTQVSLCESLYDMGVLPYYLHQLDPVQGAAHFAVDDQSALRLHQGMEKKLSGYLLPRLVREVPGADSKQTLSISQNKKKFSRP
ncbi:MAG TPA: EF-P beta-lysylation protein EpmB, partial [Chromatiaceae bacterium]|nr:EF-P beta-lysylation protein EpmB [Chromatiaceae bacterium]